MMATAPATLERPEVEDLTWAARPWVVRVWNDPVNLMSYVTYVFMSHFGFNEIEAEKRMLQVHNDGSAVVAEGNRELMEMHVTAMHEFGLWATMEQDS